MVLVLGLLFAAAPHAKAQYYGFFTNRVCYDSAGVKTDLFAYTIYVLGYSGSNGARFAFYADAQGNIVTAPDSLIYDMPCSEYVTEISPTITAGESAFTGGFTFAADTYDIIAIDNIGANTHTITIDGGTFRLLPGESFYFQSTLDPVTQEWRLNPEIVIQPGTASSNYLRYYLEAK